MATHVLARSAARASHVALEVLGPKPVQFDFAGLSQAVRGTTSGLRQFGLKPGDRILMRLGNTPDFPILYLAAIAGGFVPIPTSAQWTIPEVTQAANDCQPALVVYDQGPALPDAAIPRLDVAALRLMRELPAGADHAGDPNRPAYIIYTSGTGGQPRAVEHAHRAIWARQMMWDGWYGLSDSDRLLHAGAFNWTYTLGTGLMDPWAVGATALIPGPDTPAQDLPALLARHRATLFAAAPGVYRRLLRAPMPPLPDLRHGLSAGEKLSETLRDKWRAATGTPIHEAYGMSECSTFISGCPAKPAPANTLGFVQPGRRVKLRADGAILIHKDDPGLMRGYLDRPDETAARFDGAWFVTGDLGAMTDEGAIRYAGRRDDMMNAGGYRVSPLEVEEVLASHSQIAECAVTEVRLRTDLSLIAAFYVAPDMIDDTDLTAFCAKRLAAYKVPRIFRRVEQLPRGTNNKLLRNVLRQKWETEHGQT